MGQNFCSPQNRNKIKDNEIQFPETNIKINNNDIVIGIDFGTSGISCSYGFFKNKNEPTPVFFDGQADKNKISAEIILDNNLNVIAFGND